MKYRKPTQKKGKSPRGKSPRGKSPRSSAKKKAVRRLLLDGPSPCKTKLEISKRALFQSPPSDHAGPSKLITNNLDSQKIKRVLFSTPRKDESEQHTLKQASLREESRKRKCEEELQGPRLKWAKSLSFDCTHELKNTSKVIWDRHSSSNILPKNDTSFNQGRNELSDSHRKVYTIFFYFNIVCACVHSNIIIFSNIYMLVFRNYFGQLQRLYDAKALA